MTKTPCATTVKTLVHMFHVIALVKIRAKKKTAERKVRRHSYFATCNTSQEGTTSMQSECHNED